MAETKKMNVYQKLVKARKMFLDRNVKKSGKNFQLAFKYFELSDIVPDATEIFEALDIAHVFHLDEVCASMDIYDAENPEAPVTFSVPYTPTPPILNKEGKAVTNSMQSLGADITYLRRYLYMMVLDIVEEDEIDAGGKREEAKPKEEPKAEKKAEGKKEQTRKPATTDERKKAKENLTASNGAATQEQIDTLKFLCKELLKKDESQEEFVQQIAVKTEGFTKIPADACTALCENIQNMVAQYD